MRKFFISFFCILAYLGGFAQNKTADSLLRVVKTTRIDTVKINALNSLSYEMAGADTVLAHRYAKDALAKASKIGYSKGIIEAYYNIGYVFELLYNPTEAEKYYQKGIEASKKNNLPKQLAFGYHNYAIMLKNEASFKEALKLNLLAKDLLQRLKDSISLANVYTNIGNCYVNLNLFDLAVANHIKSLTINQKLGKNVGSAKAYNNIAIVYERNGNFQKSLENYKLALKPALASGKPVLIAAVKGNIGSAHQNLKQHAQALPYIKDALESYKQIGDKPRIALNLNNIASVYNDLTQYKLAYRASIEGIQVAREADDQESLAYAYITGGRALAGLNNYTKAIEMIDSAGVIAKQQNRASLYLNLYETGAMVYQSAGNVRKANSYYEKLITLKDSTYNAEKHAQIASLQEQYESQRKDKIIAQNAFAEMKNKTQLARNKRLLFILGSVLTALIIIVVLIIRNMRLDRIKMQTEKALVSSEAQQQLLNEKLRISSELHDNIGSQLTFIHSSIQNLRAAREDDKISLLQETEEIAINTIRDLRQTVWFINNTTFTSDDFTIRLREYLKPYQAISDITLSITNEISGNIQLSSLTATHLFRIVQEAITNAIKYADASMIGITLSQDEKKRFVITVTDNGRGFDTSLPTPGFGLRNMSARAEKTGGNVLVISEANQGTSVKVSVPV